MYNKYKYAINIKYANTLYMCGYSNAYTQHIYRESPRICIYYVHRKDMRVVCT